jgi:thiamine-phosphate pyrophosphorylase
VTPDRWCLADRRLYLCTADRPDLERFVDACIRGGVDVVQLREKHLDDRALVERALVVQRVCAFHRTPFILNDRPDLAASIGADGVHVGQDDQTPIEARRLVGDEAIIGLSTHSPTELDAAIGTLAPAPGGPGSPGGSRPRPTRAAPAPVSATSARLWNGRRGRCGSPAGSTPPPYCRWSMRGPGTSWWSDG